MSKNLAIFVSVVLSVAALLLGVAISGREALAMPVPGLLTWDTAITGVVEKLPEVSPQGDTHVLIQQGAPIPIQSDVLDLPTTSVRRSPSTYVPCLVQEATKSLTSSMWGRHNRSRQQRRDTRSRVSKGCFRPGFDL